MNASEAIAFPEGRRFAFTILDDTDDSTLENTVPMYALLERLGMRTTKTVWPLDSPGGNKGRYHRGQTLEDADYRAWIVSLASKGFEIAFHNASMTSSTRERTIEGLELVREVVGHFPTLHCNHGQNEENLYWGLDRYVGPIRRFGPLLGRFIEGPSRYLGNDEDSAYFWGDVALERFRYVRAFAFERVNCATIPPGGPFIDPRKPWVRCWFNTADAPSARYFKRLLTPPRVAELRDRGGWCIVSTHLGKGFVRSDGRVDPEIEQVLGAIAELDGWFVPASELLDHLSQSRPPANLTNLDRLHLETAHLADRVVARLRQR